MFSKLFVYTVLGTVVFMVTNAFAGAVLSDFEGEFEWKILFKSLEKYISLVVMFILVYIGFLLAGEALNMILDVNIPIQELTNLWVAEIAWSYGQQVIEKLQLIKSEMINEDVSENEEKEEEI